MNTCGLTRVLVPAFLMGFAISSATGNDLLAWLAAGVTALAVHLALRTWAAPSACPVPVTTRRSDRSVGDRPEADHSDAR